MMLFMMMCEELKHRGYRLAWNTLSKKRTLCFCFMFMFLIIMHRLGHMVLLSQSKVGLVALQFFYTSSQSTPSLAPLTSCCFLNCCEVRGRGQHFANRKQLKHVHDVTSYFIWHDAVGSVQEQSKLAVSPRYWANELDITYRSFKKKNTNNHKLASF